MQPDIYNTPSLAVVIALVLLVLSRFCHLSDGERKARMLLNLSHPHTITQVFKVTLLHFLVTSGAL